MFAGATPCRPRVALPDPFQLHRFQTYHQTIVKRLEDVHVDADTPVRVYYSELRDREKAPRLEGTGRLQTLESALEPGGLCT